MPIKNRFAEMLPEITEWRHDFHAHPELLFDVHRTAGVVAEKLRAFGCDQVIEGVGQTGVVGIIEGKGSGRTIGLRADMDALPIEEATGVDYASTVPGKMHACGHDGHTAMLLGAGKYLAETRNFAGRVVLIFQPAEEGGGGARVMLEDGLLDKVEIDEFYGLHNVPNMELGSFAIREGAFYGNADQFEIIVEAQPGHAAQPHLSIDGTVTAAHIIVALQTIPSRWVDATEGAVVSVTSVETDTCAYNVIAGEVRMRGTMRTFSLETRDLVIAKLSQIAEMTAAAHGATAKVEFNPGYPMVFNNPDATAHARAAATAVSGGCNDAELTAWGEDMSYFLQARPGAYIHLGIGPNASLHHPEYNFNDEAIPAGCSFFAELIEKRLAA